ncbi:MAG: hypothetical protein V5804_12570 [Mucilaginibacter sp.]|uniref:hypothetical protein n=1 Tax=Mucilaginibacter sp. TaxID=1882438 RepID=UPI0034E5DF06
MKTLTVNITNDKDLPIMEEILTRFGLSYQINTDYNFTEQDIKGLLKTKQEFLDGKSSARDWSEIEQDLDINTAYQTQPGILK